MDSEELARVVELARTLAVPLKRHGVRAHTFMVRDSLVLYVQLDTAGKFLTLLQEGLKCSDTASDLSIAKPSSTGGESEEGCAYQAG